MTFRGARFGLWRGENEELDQAKAWRRRRDRLQVAIVVNQLATPGLGSWMVNRRVVGAGQMILACAGFFLFLVYFVLVMRAGWLSVSLEIEPPMPPTFWWESGLGLFALAWLWAGITSIQIFLELRRHCRQQSLPPRLETSPPR